MVMGHMVSCLVNCYLVCKVFYGHDQVMGLNLIFIKIRSIINNYSLDQIHYQLDYRLIGITFFLFLTIRVMITPFPTVSYLIIFFRWWHGCMMGREFISYLTRVTTRGDPPMSKISQTSGPRL